MAPRAVGRLTGNQSGAAAATVALSLFGLVMLGGLAIDYSRMMSLDSELQNAADQAALAAATQLDGQPNACNRAIAAARSMITNQTHFANDGNTSGFTVNISAPGGTACASTGSVQFYSAYASDTSNTAATSNVDAKFVRVAVDTRIAVYALTPFMRLFNSGNLSGLAVAGLGTAICKVPPVMICNPGELADPSFTTSNYSGKGLKLVGNGTWAAGNFGFLNAGNGNGTVAQAQAIGWVSLNFDCTPGTGVETRTGNMGATIQDAFNTRFDVGDSSSCPSGGVCSPSANATKDLVKDDAIGGNQDCIYHNKGWKEASKPYVPSSNAALPTNGSQDPNAMGYPRDICHAFNATCTGQTSSASSIGDGIWDIDAYFRVNYRNVTHNAWMAATGLPANATRYQVYRWEMANPTFSLNSQVVNADRVVTGNLKARRAPYCSTPGIVAGGSNVDRRRFSVAVINCSANGVNGNKSNIPVQRWIDVFLVEPSVKRSATYKSGTNADDIYVEVIGETASGANGGTAGQTVRRDKPYLVE